ncbi:G-protein coupled receptors family 1 profile domain-containing protein [Caenorhabditis elegans]|uniref:G-protein coupled receptors family 1 profile domain-containing protein n=1 Tax=Caenorhabditis elegans TaxID=6239 RepID=G5EBF9_CAEEL|nr:G-protein coupled receptors family 1 profile domain-containing protein [Caenorhabditis elegans]CAB04462.2 G-protein coupled receptors family 1 profile domain-containing protein [Caenorhabditis elegans]|eukprot:NP_507994.2 Serpentine Receptor, class SX [Caenorhabditis elegans]
MELLLIILLFIYSTIFVVGFTGNLLMVLVTLHSKNLRSICNMLICVCCFCDLLLFTDIIAFVVSMFIPITQEFCFYINIPADFGAFASNACVLAVGIDRLIAVAAPTRYKMLEHERYKYFFILLAFPIIYSSALLIMGFGQRDPKRNVVCLLPESLGHAYDMFALTSFVINLFVPPIYAYVYFKIKNMRMNSSMKAVFKSLMVTVCLVVCGWMTTDLIGALTVTLPMDKDVARMIQLYCGTFIFTSSAFNAVVYYKLSRDYRSAMRTMLGLSNEISIAKGTTYQQATDAQRSSIQRPSTNTNALNTIQQELHI